MQSVLDGLLIDRRAQHSAAQVKEVLGISMMQLLILSGGTVRCLYDETIDLSALGRMTIARGSHVEPDSHGKWFADLGPVKGPKLGPFPCRSQALEAEQAWLEAKWLR